MEMAQVQAGQEILIYHIGQVKFMGTDDIGFRTDTKEFTFDGIPEHSRVVLLGIDLVQGIQKARAVFQPSGE